MGGDTSRGAEPLMSDLDRLEALRAAATPGEWTTYPSRSGQPGLVHVKIPDSMHPTAWPADAALIVAAVNALPDLIGRIRELEGREAKLREYFVEPRHDRDGSEVYQLLRQDVLAILDSKGEPT